MTFSSSLRNARFAKSLSQRDVAALLGVVMMTVSRWERGERVPDDDEQARILRVIRASKRRQSRADADISRRAKQRTQLGRILRVARERAGLTQEALARKSGCAANQVSGFERGERAPSPDTLARLRRALAIR